MIHFYAKSSTHPRFLLTILKLRVKAATGSVS